MPDELLELSRLRADLAPADDAKMARARAALVHTATSVPARRRRRPTRVAGMAVAGAAVVAALVIVPGAGDNAPAASAVTVNADGTVSVKVADLGDVGATNQVLADKGIDAELIAASPPGSCAPGTELGDPLPMPADLYVVDDTPDTVITFRPDLIPAGERLFIFNTGWSAVRVVMPESSSGTPEPGREFPLTPVLSAELHPEDTGTCHTVSRHLLSR